MYANNIEPTQKPISNHKATNQNTLATPEGIEGILDFINTHSQSLLDLLRAYRRIS